MTDDVRTAFATAARHPFVTATFGSARAALEDAREAQKNAIIFYVDIFRLDERGKRARRLHPFWIRRRAAKLAEAKRLREAAKEIRRRFAASLAKAAPTAARAAELAS